MEKKNIEIPQHVIETSKVNAETYKCNDGSPVWVDLNVGEWKGPNGNTSLSIEAKAEYVNKNLIRELWNKFWELDEEDDHIKYVQAIDYFLNN